MTPYDPPHRRRPVPAFARYAALVSDALDGDALAADEPDAVGAGVAAGESDGATREAPDGEPVLAAELRRAARSAVGGLRRRVVGRAVRRPYDAPAAAGAAPGGDERLDRRG